MLRMKLQYSGHLIQKADSLEKTLMLRKIEGGRSGRPRMGRLDGITDSLDTSLSKLWKMVKVAPSGSDKGPPKLQTTCLWLSLHFGVHLALLFLGRFLCISHWVQRAQDDREAEVMRRTGGSLAQQGLSSGSHSPWATLE